MSITVVVHACLVGTSLNDRFGLDHEVVDGRQG